MMRGREETKINNAAVRSFVVEESIEAPAFLGQ